MMSVYPVEIRADQLYYSLNGNQIALPVSSRSRIATVIVLISLHDSFRRVFVFSMFHIFRTLFMKTFVKDSR